ncbi:MAG: ferric reductase-like transmembrane domain-containing protein [Paracoccaceae bacterium]
MRALVLLFSCAALIGTALFAAATSSLIQWREPVYIAAGYAGVVAMALLLLQPLFVIGALPGMSGPRGKRWHRVTGLALILLILVHVGGLWITSPPDVVDALTFTSPTPFAPWGVIAMWAAFVAAALAFLRRRIGLRVWRPAHSGLVTVVVAGTVVHALLIDGTMGTISKAALAVACLAALAVALLRLKPWLILVRRRRNG